MKIIKSALPPLAKEEAKIYLAKAQGGDLEARELLVRHNLLLVQQVASRFKGVENFDDLFQVGCIGLIKAIDSFDLTRDTAFSTFAVPKILGEIRMYLRDYKPIKVSRDLQRVSIQVKDCRRQLEQKLGREPSIGEIAAQLNMGSAEAAAAETALAPPAELVQNDSCELIDELRIALKEVIGRLPARERQVIALRFFSELSQQEVAVRLGISQGHVSRIEREVLVKLRSAMA